MFIVIRRQETAKIPAQISGEHSGTPADLHRDSALESVGDDCYSAEVPLRAELTELVTLLHQSLN